MQSFDCVVKYNSGAYTTNTARGQRASCTASARQAAQRLGEKLFGEAFLRAEQLLPTEHGHITLWRIFASTEG